MKHACLISKLHVTVLLCILIGNYLKVHEIIFQRHQASNGIFKDPAVLRRFIKPISEVFGDPAHHLRLMIRLTTLTPPPPPLTSKCPLPPPPPPPPRGKRHIIQNHWPSMWVNLGSCWRSRMAVMVAQVRDQKSLGYREFPRDGASLIILLAPLRLLIIFPHTPCRGMTVTCEPSLQWRLVL